MSKTKAERDYMNRVASLGCILCRHLGYGESSAELHHPRTGQGMAMRASNFSVIPLCPEHHRGNTGLHGMGRKAFERQYGLTEIDLQERVVQLLKSETANSGELMAASISNHLTER